MGPRRNSPGESGGNKLLWAGVAIVVILVLGMGITLMRLQALPQEPRLGALPALEAPPANAAPAMTSASTEAVSSAAALPPASTAPAPLVDTPKPRIVQPRTSEPAVARAPQRVASKPDTAEGSTQPDVQR